MRTVAEKMQMVRAALAAEQSGETLSTLCEAMDWPESTVHRYLRQYQDGGEEALKPQRHKCGRRKDHVLTDHEAKVIRYLDLELRSQPLAIEKFLETTDCRPETRHYLLSRLDEAAERGRAFTLPPSFRAQIKVTAAMRAAHRGPKHVQQETEMVSRKVYKVREADGSLRWMYPDEVWQSDDYSTNCPYIIEDTGPRGGFRVCRQMLCTIDAYTAGWRGVEAIGRDHDSYRAEDIVRHMLRTIDAAGTMPVQWDLERGRWENNLVMGLPIPERDGKRWGGLDELFRISYKYKSRGKALVEGGFDLLQKILDIESLSIGRSRGEFEAAAKKLSKVQSRASAFSMEELKAFGFWDILECAEAHRRCAEWLNARPKERHGIGRISADALRAKSPEVKRPLPESERWRFAPVKRMATVRRGFVECQVEGYQMSFRFPVNGSDAGYYFDEGYKVLVAFDPAEAWRGCHVFNRAQGAENVFDKAFGELLLVAPQEDEVAFLDYSGSREGLGIRKKAAVASRSEYRGIAQAGKAALKISQSKDGRGNSATMEGGREFRESEPARRGSSEPRNPGPLRRESGEEAAEVRPARRGGYADPLMNMLLGED